MNKDTGGPAFPTENARQTGASTWHYEGMTLRDYFSAKAMQGMFASGNLPKSVTNEEVAEVAYDMADTMLEERMK